MSIPTSHEGSAIRGASSLDAINSYSESFHEVAACQGPTKGPDLPTFDPNADFKAGKVDAGQGGGSDWETL